MSKSELLMKLCDLSEKMDTAREEGRIEEANKLSKRINEAAAFIPTLDRK